MHEPYTIYIYIHIYAGLGLYEENSTNISHASFIYIYIYMPSQDFFSKSLHDLAIVEISDDENQTPAAPLVLQQEANITRASIMAALKESFGIVI